ncbi:Beta-phosphoglucomutase [Kordia antarctica]|uniref:Beta-phosphoglucomutase n=1 Tax=Kordia antarctica TaxID=1218801 RepID=A0A7L4ZM35_9FLAO|nr:beta-phosphoglucomutase [Kordia antarctica]QHI37788.1 Beta-phosphoglucomutase [Kordia antarctica]
MNTKGFIFDLDGVIVDTAKYHYLSWKQLANELGFDITLTQNEQLKGVSRVRSLEIILGWGNKTLSEEAFEKYMAEKNENYLSHIAQMDEGEILPDVPKILNYLQEKQQGIALGSASKNARTILQKVNLFENFQAIADGNNVSKAKPDPEVFLLAAKQLNIKPSDCIVFEDAVAGVTAANAAGMISIGIGSKETLGHADYIFNDFTEIQTSFIDELINR